jgi:hypothetical protein
MLFERIDTKGVVLFSTRGYGEMVLISIWLGEWIFIPQNKRVSIDDLEFVSNVCMDWEHSPPWVQALHIVN